MPYCKQCAEVTGGPVAWLKPDATTMALKGQCDNCGYVWMSRDSDCVDANCPVHCPKNTPETGQHRLARQAAPSRDGERPGAPVAVGPQAAGRFSPEGWTFEDHGNGVVYVRAPSGKHAAIGYLAPGDMVLSGILHELVGAVLAFNSTPTV